MSNAFPRGAFARAGFLVVIAIALAFALVGPSIGRAAEASDGRCEDASVPKKQISDAGGRWTELSPDEWQFLRGIYAMNPATPSGLPYGDKAVLAQVDGRDGGLVFFIDGDMACVPMAVPDELLTMMKDVAAKVIRHEGEGL